MIGCQRAGVNWPRLVLFLERFASIDNPPVPIIVEGGDQCDMGKRAKIISEIERHVSRLENRPGLCLHYAHHTAVTLWKHGLQAVIQAGSLQWPRVRHEDDDGQMNTHFAYMWTPHDPMSAMSVALGNLPEMHVWVGIVDRQELVDFTTRHLKRAAAPLGPWTATDPPSYLWCPANQTPDWVVYRPDRDASLYACTILKRLFDPIYLKRK